MEKESGSIGDDDPWLGAQFGNRYRLDELIGKGAFGRVYKATHLTLDKQFAIKILPAVDKNNTQWARRFEREAKAASSVEAENVVMVTDFGLIPCPYLVMELVDGPNLAVFLSQVENFPWRQSVELACQMLTALDAVHKAGFVHRDFKPSNVLVVRTPSGAITCKLTDFGLAKALVDDLPGEQLTLTGEMFGSPPYMSPEQWSSGRIDAATDIYSFGCVLYEILCGRKAFLANDSAQLIQKHLHERPEPLVCKSAGIAVNSQLHSIVDKCLEKDRVNRYCSAREVELDLRLVLAGKRPKLVNRPKAAMKRERARKVLLRVLIAIATIGALACIFLFVRQDILIAYLWQTKFNDANRAMAEGNIDSSIPLLLQCAEFTSKFENVDPRKLSTLTALLNCYRTKKDSIAFAGVQAQLDLATGKNVSEKWATLHQMASNDLENGKLRSALFDARRAIKEAELYGDFSLSLALSLELLSKAYLLERNYTRSADCAMRALTIRQKLLPAGDPQIGFLLGSLALPLSYLGKYRESETLYDQAIQILEGKSGSYAINLAQLKSSKAANLFRWGKLTQAEKMYLSLLVDAKSLPDAEGEQTYGTACNNLAQVYRKMGKLAEASHYLSIAIDICIKYHGKNHADLELLYHNLAMVYMQQNQLSKAKQCIEEAIRLRQISFPDHVNLANDYLEYAKILRLLGQAKEADQANRQSAILRLRREKTMNQKSQFE